MRRVNPATCSQTSGCSSRSQEEKCRKKGTFRCLEQCVYEGLYEHYFDGSHIVKMYSSNGVDHLLRCRGCHHHLSLPFLNLGLHPLSNAFVKCENINRGEIFYPLEVFVCEKCWLVQLSEPAKREEIFTEDYVYFSSFSASWLEHSKTFAKQAREKLKLGKQSLVMEVASNDGYLLQFFQSEGVPVLGIEPSASVAKSAQAKGIQSLIQFFGAKSARQIASQYGLADLICANNVLAHVPDLHDFIMGFKNALKPTGVVTFEFPHLLSLIKGLQFDTIYHEHFSYLSLTALSPIFERVGLRVFDVETLATHGGSLRLWLAHAENQSVTRSAQVDATFDLENSNGLTDLQTFQQFSRRVMMLRQTVLNQMIEWNLAGKKVAAYGAAAKGNTLLNFCAIRSDLIQAVADKNPAKQGRLMPGSRIPVVTPEKLMQSRPDFLIILPWNLKAEIAQQLAAIRDWDGRFVSLIPSLEVF